MLACHPIYDVTIDLAVSVDGTAFAREILVFGMNMESVRLKFCGTEFATQILVVSTQPELVGVARLILNAVVYVVVGDAGASAERNLTAIIWEEV